MTLDERAKHIIQENPSLRALLPVVMKELIHYDIFFHLTQTGLMPADMVFIGGTCLRLCHNSKRFSEDLDFHAGANFKPSDFDLLRESLERYLTDTYKLPVEVREPTVNAEDPNYSNTTANTWKVLIETSPGRRELPKQRVHIDIANLPTHEVDTDVLKTNYSGLPDGYDSIMVRRSSKNEILADKYIALAARNNIKARDLWDIQWLSQQGVKLNIDLLNKKIVDHGIADFQHLLRKKEGLLKDYWQTSAFSSEMSRFLDSDRLSATVGNADFLLYLQRAIAEQIDGIFTALSPDAGGFRM